MANLDYNDFRRRDCVWRMVLPANSLKLLDFLTEGWHLATPATPRRRRRGLGRRLPATAPLPRQRLRSILCRSAHRETGFLVRRDWRVPAAHAGYGRQAERRSATDAGRVFYGRPTLR